ncbi:hypothetical protein LSH36_1048g00007 [Paralvinella palmiformis]|uniref:Cyclic nucleotide-binding domain-containing protein n=1 Tax=Paralvinella palmiformis TaxID=53620 RepID=A0AAD9IWB5_9ANNE|nr:hypothetical protein LSH36_1048g00007 [Paralvinella palmiformis]
MEMQPIRRWRRTTRLVRMLCGVCIALRKYVVEAGLMTNYVMAVKRRKSLSDDSEDEMEEITFCLKNFQMKKELSVPLVLINAMEKTPNRRTEQETLAISHLMRNLPSFRNYTQDMQLEMSRIVRYQKCEKGRVVLRKGHIGYSVYFIYSGSVSVVLDAEGEEMYVRKPKVILRKGACFGEIALLRDARRNATIVCAEECEFLVIDKDDFIESGLHLMVEEELNNRFTFFRNWPPFEEVSDDVIHHMASISRTEYFNYNKVVINDSRRNENIWFVVEGSCDVLRLVDLRISPKYRRIAKLMATDQHHYLVNGAYNQVKPATKARNNSSTKTEPNNKRHTEAENPPETNIYVKLDTLRDGQSFGLDDFFNSDDDFEPCRHSLVSKACTVIHISRDKLAEILDPDTVQLMKPFGKSYPTDMALCESFLSKSEWNNYKQEVVSDILSNLNHRGNGQQTGRDVKRNSVTSYGRHTRTKRDDVDVRSSDYARSVKGQSSKFSSSTKFQPKIAVTTTPGNVERISSPVGKHKLWSKKLNEYTTRKHHPSSALPSLTSGQRAVAVVTKYTRPVSADAKILVKSTRTKRPTSHIS